MHWECGLWIYLILWYYLMFLYLMLFTGECIAGLSIIVSKKLKMSVEKDTKLQMESEDKVVINQK